MILLSLGSILVLVIVLKEIKNFNASPESAVNPHQITVSGEGDVTAVADIATFTYSVTETAATVQDAQNSAATKSNAALAYLKSNGIDDKDINTSDYNVSPQYSYSNSPCFGGACSPGNPTITGYEVSESITVKVRDTSKAGDILSGLGKTGVTNISGLQFTIDDPEGLQEQARTKAIADAKAQAQKLAADLGVHLGAITSFSEDTNGGGPIPLFAAKAADSAAAPAVSPQLPTGENKITSDVSITFDIY